MKILSRFLSYFSSSRTAGEGLSTAPHRRSFVPRAGAVDLLSAGCQPYGAMQVSTVFACVRIMAESVAALPLRVMEQRGDIYEDAKSHPLSYLLNVAPNEYTSAFDFWSAAVQELLLEGNAYIVPQYDAAARGVARLVLCARGTVMHDATAATYTVNDPAQGVVGTYGEEEVIHLKNVSIDGGRTGVSTLHFARLTAGIASQGDNETLSRFANGGNIRGIISNDNGVRGFGEYQDQELDKAARDLDSDFDRQRIVSLPGGVDFKQLSLSSTDMQFLETRKFTVREICRFFRVPPTFVYDDTATNYKSAENASIAFLSQSLGPLLRKIENELRRKLIPRALASRRLIEFDRRSLFAADLDSRVNYQTKTIAAGIYSVNDWRREENRPPVEGGDKIFVSTNLRGINDPLPSAARNNPLNDEQ